jgi:hypothetical protein
MTNYAPPPPPPAMPYQPPTKRPWWKALWVIALAGVILGLIIGAAGASGSSSKTKTVAGPTTTVSVSPAAPPTATVTATVTGHPIKVIATHTRVVTHTYTPPPAPAINDGTYIVGTDIKPGLWRTKGGDCYWARLKDLHGGVDSIAANNNISGPTVVEITSSDRAFEISGGCDWRRSNY